MREIKFRAITTQKENKSHSFNEVWVYGDLVQIKNNAYIHPKSNSFDTNGEVAKLVIMHEIKTETLGQYTGLKDKNGKEIYEGDIVYMRCDGLSGFGEVIFENGCFWIDDKKRKRTYPLYNEGEYRVDGNIYENPELLGDE